MHARLCLSLFLVFLFCNPLQAGRFFDVDSEEEGFDMPWRHSPRVKRADGDPKATLITRIRAIFTTLLTEQQISEVMDKMDQCKREGKTQNATVRAVCILCLRFFQTPNVQKIIDRIKKNFTPEVCNAVAPLLRSVMLIDLYGFDATPCTGTNDGSQCLPTPCEPIDVMAMISSVLG